MLINAVLKAYLYLLTALHKLYSHFRDEIHSFFFVLFFFHPVCCFAVISNKDNQVCTA